MSEMKILIKIIIALLNEVEILTNQYNAVVKQNKSLQKEINRLTKK